MMVFSTLFPTFLKLEICSLEVIFFFGRLWDWWPYVSMEDNFLFFSFSLKSFITVWNSHIEMNVAIE